MSNNLLLFCAPTWPSYYVVENHVLLAYRKFLKLFLFQCLCGCLDDHEHVGDKKATNLHIGQRKTVFLHTLHVRVKLSILFQNHGPFASPPNISKEKQHKRLCFKKRR